MIASEQSTIAVIVAEDEDCTEGFYKVEVLMDDRDVKQVLSITKAKMTEINPKADCIETLDLLIKGTNNENSIVFGLVDPLVNPSKYPISFEIIKHFDYPD